MYVQDVSVIKTCGGGLAYWVAGPVATVSGRNPATRCTVAAIGSHRRHGRASVHHGIVTTVPREGTAAFRTVGTSGA
jgi:hypothetical protein